MYVILYKYVILTTWKSTPLVCSECGSPCDIDCPLCNSYCYNCLYDRSGGKGWHVFYHFVGAVPGSTELELMLRRLLKETGTVNVSLHKNLVDLSGNMTGLDKLSIIVLGHLKEKKNWIHAQQGGGWVFVNCCRYSQASQMTFLLTCVSRRKWAQSILT